LEKSGGFAANKLAVPLPALPRLDRRPTKEWKNSVLLKINLKIRPRNAHVTAVFLLNDPIIKMVNKTGEKIESSKDQGFLLVITGPSGVGKDSIIGEFLKRKPDFKKIVTDTSRPPRVGEVNGIDYNFYSQNEFLEKAAKSHYLEHVEVRPKEYKGTPKSAVEQILSGKKVIWKIDEYGAANLQKTFEKQLRRKAAKILKRTITVYVAPEEWKQLREQYFERESEANKQWFRIKLERDKEMWKKYHDCFNYIVINHRQKLMDTVTEIEKIIAARI